MLTPSERLPRLASGNIKLSNIGSPTLTTPQELIILVSDRRIANTSLT